MQTRSWFFGIILGFLWLSLAQAASDGEIRGSVLKIENGEKKPAPNLTVRLRIFRNEFQIAAAESITNQKGEFWFQKLNTSSNHLYLPKVEYQEVLYTQSPQRFPKSKQLITFRPFEVYPATTDPSELIANENVILEFGKTDILRATHTLYVKNPTSFAYNPNAPNSKPIQIQLRRGGFDLNLLSGVSRNEISIDEKNSTLKLKKALLPGTSPTIIRFSYLYPFHQRKIDFKLPLSITRKSFDLVLTGNSPKIYSDKLTQQPNLPFKGKTALIFSGGPISADEEFRFTISGLTLKKDLAFHLLFLGLGLVGLFSIVLLWYSTKTQAGMNSKQASIEAFLEALFDLKKEFENKKITQRVYDEEAARIREELFYMMRNQESETPA